MNKLKSSEARKIKLLLVDDEKEYVKVLSKRLGKRGIETTIALNGVQGLQSLRRQYFDLMILDLKLGDMDGIEVLKICKKIATDLPIIILTGHGSVQATQEGIKLGAFDYLTKPCELEELMQKINEALRVKYQG